MMLTFIPNEDGVFVMTLVSAHIRSLTRPKSQPPVDLGVFHGELRRMFVLYFSLSIWPDEEYKQQLLSPTSC